MKKDIPFVLDADPQYAQSSTMSGMLEGEVVSVRDPHQRGSAKVMIYGLDGDYKELDVKNLDWATPIQTIRGAYAPPQLWDRLRISFEAGDKSKPKILGYTTAAPMGDGKLPFNKRIGSEIRPECWHHHNLYPESIMFGSSGCGSAVWMNDLWLDKQYIASSITIMDTAGKFIRTRSYHLEDDYYCKEEKVPEGKGSLYQGDFEETKPVRSGFEYLDAAEEYISGAVEFGHKNLKHHMIATKTEFTLDHLIQKTEDDGVTHEEQTAGGMLWRKRQGSASMAMMMNANFALAPGGMFVNKLMTAPRRFDDDEEETDNGGGQLA